MLRATVMIFLLLWAGASFGEDDDKRLALLVLKKSLECPIALESYREGTYSTHLKTRNAFTGSLTNFVNKEHWEGAEMDPNAEAYETVGINTVVVPMKSLGKVTVSGSKATIHCHNGRKCITVGYEMPNPGHDPEWQDYTTKKSSYRLSTCGGEAARDVKEAIQFLIK